MTVIESTLQPASYSSQSAIPTLSLGDNEFLRFWRDGGVSGMERGTHLETDGPNTAFHVYCNVTVVVVVR